MIYDAGYPLQARESGAAEVNRAVRQLREAAWRRTSRAKRIVFGKRCSGAQPGRDAPLVAVEALQ